MKKFVKILLIVCFATFGASFALSSFAEKGIGLYKHSLKVKGVTRIFYIYIPKNYRNTSAKMPVVMVFHGSNADGKSIMTYSGFNKIADKNNFIVVYPNKKTFYDWHLENVRNNNELDFVKQIIEYLSKNYRINQSRVYAAGYSSGAELSTLLACTMPDKIAAVAGVSGNMRQHFEGICRDTNKPVSIFMINGTSDVLAPLNGDGLDKLSLNDSVNYWKVHNKCKPKEILTNFKNKSSQTSAMMKTAANCADNTEVDYLEIRNGGHTWPGGVRRDFITELCTGNTNYDINASAMMWAFFSRHQVR